LKKALASNVGNPHKIWQVHSLEKVLHLYLSSPTKALLTMPPSMQVSVDYDNSVDASSLLEQAAMELSRITENELVPFPPNCHQLLRSIPGNQVCADCHSVEPDWASVCYGAVICMQCSGKHRSLGVQVRLV
jgi:Arf-GAP/coiled-coil/ANK repeat/PH domain-containing protein